MKAWLVALVVTAGALPASAARAQWPGFCRREVTGSGVTGPRRDVQRWDREGRLSATIDAAGERCDYEYEHGRLVRVRAPGGGDAYGYDDRGLLTSVVSSTGTRVQIAYDAAGREIWRGGDGRGGRTLAYDAAGHEVDEADRDPDGTIVHEVRRTYVGEAVIRVARSCTRGKTIDTWETETRRYDRAGRHVETVVRGCDGQISHRLRNEHDGRGRVVTVRRLAGDAPAVVVERDVYGPRGQLRRLTYDEDGRALHVETWQDDADGNPLVYERRQAVTGRWERHTFDYSCWTARR